MCGQIGFSSTEVCDITKIKTLLLWNSLERGKDSTGIYSPLNGLKRTLKQGSEAIIDPEFEIIPDKMLMGHVRASTVGYKAIHNTHPFNRGHYYLQHNGTLKNHYALLRKYKLEWNDYSVDSDIITGCIYKSNSFFPLKEIDGAAAIIIHDDRVENTLYVYRNNERPLFRGMINQSMYISSIKESLILIECTDIKEFKEDIFYTIKEGKIIDTKKCKSTPYKEPVTNNVISNNLKYALNGWVRSTSNYTYNDHLSKDKQFILTKNKWYYVREIVDSNFLILYDYERLIEYNVYKAHINEQDIIVLGDYLKVLMNITTTNGLEIASENDVLIAGTNYGDGDIQLKYTNGTYATMTNKKCVRKMDHLEVELFKKGNTSPLLNNNSFLETLEEVDCDNNNPIITAENENLESENGNIINDDYIVNLCSFFEEMDDRLEYLYEFIKTKCPNEELENTIKELIDFNYTDGLSNFIETEPELEQNAGK